MGNYSSGFRRAVLLGLGVAGATAARAETFDVKPGLWEVTHTTETRGTPPIDTSKLTPEQRARFEEAMKASQGTRTETIRSCLTQDQLEKQLFPMEKENASCKHLVLSSSRTIRHERMECAGPPKLSGELRFEAMTREQVKGTMNMTVGEGPRAMTVNSSMMAKWIGTNCGDVK